MYLYQNNTTKCNISQLILIVFYLYFMYKKHFHLLTIVCFICIISTVMKTQPNIGDWSNGMIGVSKTFGGSSILSSPAKKP